MKNIVKDYAKKSLSDLEKEAQTMREDIAKARLDMKAKPPKDTNIISKKRKRLAVILTLANALKHKEASK